MAVCSRSTTTDTTSVIFCIAILYVLLQATAAAPCESEDEWWLDPCSKKSQFRHGRSPQRDRFWIMLVELEKLYENIRLLYNNEHTQKPKKDKSLLKVGKLLKPIRTAKNYTEGVRHFYLSTVEIGRYMNRLEATRVETQSDLDVSARRKIFNDARNHIKAVLCEFADNEFNGKIKQIKRWIDRRAKKNRGPKCPTKSLPLTWLQIRDLDFFFKIKRFFNRSYKTLMKLQKRNNNSKKRIRGGKKNGGKKG